MNTFIVLSDSNSWDFLEIDLLSKWHMLYRPLEERNNTTQYPLKREHIQPSI